MNLNFLAFAIPLFIGLMAFEYWIAKKQQKTDYFSFQSSVANISVGIAERLSDIFVVGIFYFVYDYLQKRFGIFEIKPTIILWVALLLFTDFVWYWYHRIAHEVNIVWAAHVVHHQSEFFNYTTSVRITVFQAFVRTGFWCILPVIGFPAHMISVLLLVHGIYPFFTHTRLIGKLGILEYIFVTPSHHRVHHASNDCYLDKNYGDVFIIWDKLFGTFAKENENINIKFGLTKPLASYSFLWQHFHYFIELIFAAKKKKGIIKKLKVFFENPQYHDPEARAAAEQVFKIKSQMGVLHKPVRRYIVIQMAFLLATLFFFILVDHYLDAWMKAAYLILVLLTLINCGAIMEQKKWIFQIELIRLLIVTPLLLFFIKGFALLYCSVVILFILLLASREYLHQKYLDWLYPTAYFEEI